VSEGLQGKRVVVTGDAQGLGAAAVRTLVANSASVVSVDVVDDLGTQVAADAARPGNGSTVDRRSRQHTRERSEDPAHGKELGGRRRRVARHIEEVALALFAERGYANVTVAEIARAAGVGARTVARYFPLKEDLLLATPRETQRSALEALRGLAGEADPLGALIREYQRLARLHAGEIPRFDAWSQAIVTAPELWAKVRGENMIALERPLACYMAEALGVDIDDDVRPLALASAALAAVDAINRFKADRTGGDVHEMLETVLLSLRTDFARLRTQHLQAEAADLSQLTRRVRGEDSSADRF
jgi:AcrR family transcriptional regulator